MAKSTRVFQIARDLGISSKAILEKCRAEDVELNNHMSAVSVGLEATIREWFSDSHVQGGGTAVETAQTVDLTKARRKARRKKAVEPEPPPAEEAEADAAVATAEAETPAVAVEAQAPEAPPEPETVEPAALSISEAPIEELPPEAPPIEAPPDEAEAQPAELPAEAAEAPEPEEPSEPAKPRVVPNVPKRPDVVAPAGPRLETPEAAQLKGPKVVRVEAPEPVRKPRPRTERTDRAAPPRSPAAPDLIRSRGPARGRGAAPTGGEDTDVGRSPRRRRGGPADRTPPRGGDGRKGRVGAAEQPERRGGKWSQQDLLELEERISRAGGYLKQRRHQMRKQGEGGGPAATPISVGGQVEINEPITIKGLSAATGIKGTDIVRFLMDKGVMATINATIDSEAAIEICLEHAIELVVKGAQTAEAAVVEELEQRERTDVQRRPPVVAVLGHVDHGKTSLLDQIRRSNVVDGEDGGITQHIGAYRVTVEGSEGGERTVVFLDTPGHEAFTAMRARGANLTDIVVLVVAADDGVMPQTIESINHAKAAQVPIVVALNKVDRPEATEANVQKIYGQLAEHDLNPVAWGGTTEVVQTSATTGQGVSDIVEMLDYQAELLELTADYAGPAHGQVIEAELHPGRGSVARLLLREGQMKVGDFIVMGRSFGRVRDMIDDRGRQIEQAGPATPLQISGIDLVPDAGDPFYVTTSLRKAEQIADQRREQERRRVLASRTQVSLDTVFERMQEAADVSELNVVLKADVQGSIEVLRKTLEEMGSDQVSIKVLHAAVGGVAESDVLLAEASSAVIIGFHVIASAKVRTEAERRGVDIRLYRVIYDLIDDLTRALEGMLTPEKREEVLGHAEVREAFRVSRVGTVAGCYVTDGVVRRNASIRVTRDGIVIEDGRTLSSLKRFKDDARDVRAGMECGMKVDGYDDIRVGDVMECFQTTEVKATLA